LHLSRVRACLSFSDVLANNFVVLFVQKLPSLVKKSFEESVLPQIFNAGVNRYHFPVKTATI